jgi:hypothetical protein
VQQVSKLIAHLNGVTHSVNRSFIGFSRTRRLQAKRTPALLGLGSNLFDSGPMFFKFAQYHGASLYLLALPVKSAGALRRFAKRSTLQGTDMPPELEGKGRQRFFESMKLKYNKCLFPFMVCEKTAIQAHSVQKSTALSFIEEAGHVCELRTRIKNGPVCEFVKVGRNTASTFTGFCSQHDAMLFRPIDTEPLDLEDEKQLFLIAYRSITRELHAAIEGARKIQAVYRSHVDQGLIMEEDWSAAAQSTYPSYKSWITYLYRHNHYDSKLVRGLFQDVSHSIFKISGRRALLAASSFFAVDDRQIAQNTVWIALNVVPLAEDETAVIFSYPRVHSEIAERRIAPVMQKTGEGQLLALSTLVLDTTENFFIRPSNVASWSNEKKALIEKAYLSTATEGAVLSAQPEFMLF